MTATDLIKETNRIRLNDLMLRVEEEIKKMEDPRERVEFWEALWPNGLCRHCGWPDKEWGIRGCQCTNDS